MESSVTGFLSAARHTAPARNSAIRAAISLRIVFTGHCTPVQRVQKRSLLAPSRLHAHVQVKIDLDAENPLHLLARQRPDALEHRAFSPDHDRLLPVPLDVDRGVDA